MKTWIYLLSLAIVGSNVAPGGESQKLSYYVQLIHGGNREKPPLTDAKPIDAKLSKKLRPIYIWKSYWEMNRQKVELARGQKVMVRLSQEREVEISLMHPGKRTVAVYERGKPFSRTIQPIGEEMTIIGGEHDSTTVWFVIVRRDKPAPSDPANAPAAGVSIE
jgi:hypothetical protein